MRFAVSAACTKTFLSCLFACAEQWPTCIVFADCRIVGTSPAWLQSGSAFGKRLISPISARRVMARIGPMPGIVISSFASLLFFACACNCVSTLASCLCTVCNTASEFCTTISPFDCFSHQMRTKRIDYLRSMPDEHASHPSNFAQLPYCQRRHVAFADKVCPQKICKHTRVNLIILHFCKSNRFELVRVCYSNCIMHLFKQCVDVLSNICAFDYNATFARLKWSEKPSKRFLRACHFIFS